MELKKAVSHVFMQLAGSLEPLSAEQYNHACQGLSGNTIGQHVRHIIEMFQCLEQGYDSGQVDYDTRRRDKKIETEKEFALILLPGILQGLAKENKELLLLTSFGELGANAEQLTTNYFREVAYNLEHTIHHMALIRVGLREAGDVAVSDAYGVASSTLKHRGQCAQ